MQFFVQLRFTEATSEKVIALQERLARALGVVPDTRLKPHITLGAGTVDDAEVLAASLQAALQAQPAFDIRLGSSGVFGGESGVLFLSPAYIRALVALYEKLLPQLERYAQSLQVLYTPTFWVSHCTLLMGLNGAQLAQGTQILADGFSPIMVRADRLELCDHPSLELLQGWTLAS